MTVGSVRPGSADENDDAECGQDHRDQDRHPEAPDVGKHRASMPLLTGDIYAPDRLTSADGYDHMGTAFTARNDQRSPEVRRWFIDEVNAEGSRVFELGCGPGTDAEELSRRRLRRRTLRPRWTSTGSLRANRRRKVEI